MKRIAIIALAVLTHGCGLFDPYCDEIGVYPSCYRVGSSYVCPSSGYVCADFGTAYDRGDCKDRGGVVCRIREDY